MEARSLLQEEEEVVATKMGFDHGDMVPYRYAIKFHALLDYTLTHFTWTRTMGRSSLIILLEVRKIQGCWQLSSKRHISPPIAVLRESHDVKKSQLNNSIDTLFLV